MEPLKYLFNHKVVETLSESCSKFYPIFKSKEFKSTILDDNWEKRELKDRISFIAICLNQFLPTDFKKACTIIEKVSEELPAGFEQLPLPTYVEFYGIGHFDSSMQTIKTITTGSTCEFAVRPFLKENPTKTLAIMKKWANHKNEHVRRLSSEGCRPRLPWGGNFQAAIENPKSVLEILEILKNDGSLYVRKSVANNLNDISKDHPELVLRISSRWLRENHTHAKWIVKRALRGLLKNAHPSALQLFGYGDSNSIEVKEFKTVEKSLKIGERLNFSFEIENRSKDSQKLRVEYLINYCKKNGSSAKVFQLSEFDLNGKSKRGFTKYQSFADLTTRKHYAGNHEITIRVNGELKGSLNFELER